MLCIRCSAWQEVGNGAFRFPFDPQLGAELGKHQRERYPGATQTAARRCRWCDARPPDRLGTS